MFTIIGLMLAGMLLGYLLQKWNLTKVQQVITCLIWLLLFILGIEVGSNEQIVRGLHTIGLEALLLTLGGTLGSVVAAWALWKALYPTKGQGDKETKGQVDKGTRKQEDKVTSQQGDELTKEQGPCSLVNSSARQLESSPNSLINQLKGSLIIVGFFAVGTVVGVSGVLPFNLAETSISFCALAALMFSVGLSMGNDPQTLKNFRQLNPRLVFLPVMTIVGTLAGSAIISLLLTHRSLTDCLAIGSGFGYYSLSSIFITEYRGAELGTIALLANICREILTLLAAPLLVRWFGNLAPISAGGATTMDTTLPIITRTSGQQFVVVSIFHGFVVDFSVPFLVTLFCSL